MGGFLVGNFFDSVHGLGAGILIDRGFLRSRFDRVVEVDVILLEIGALLFLGHRLPRCNLEVILRDRTYRDMKWDLPSNLL